MVEKMVTIRCEIFEANDRKVLRDKINKWVSEAPDFQRFIDSYLQQCYNPKTDSFIWSSQVWYEVKEE